VFPTEDDSEPFTPVDGFDLVAYVEVCRSLVRVAGGSTRRVEEVLAGHGLTHDAWDRISASWSARIRGHAGVHAEFGRLYALPSGEPRNRND
jgi:hypothetical protein